MNDLFEESVVASKTLPVLSFDVVSEVRSTNIAEYKERAIEIIDAINLELNDDSDFAAAEEDIKFCESVEAKMKELQAEVLARMDGVNKLMSSLEEVDSKSRGKRLFLNRAVKERKEYIKSQIIANAKAELAEHIISLGESITVPCDFESAIKGKKNLATANVAVQDALNNAKQAADLQAATMSANRLAINAAGHAFLFNDEPTLVRMPHHELRQLIGERIANYEKVEAERREAAENLARENEQALKVERAPEAPETIDVAPEKETISIEVPELVEDELVIPEWIEPTYLSLGDINARIAPLSIRGDGLEALGFKADKMDKRAMLFDETRLPAIKQAMIAVLTKES